MVTVKAGLGVMLATLLGGALLGACSTKSGTAAAPVLEADLPAQYAQALCSGIQGCCGQVGYPYDSAACIATETAVAKDGLSKSRPTDVVYDAVAAGNCVAKLREIASTCADPSDHGRALEDTCSAVFAGKKQLGEACENGGACAPRSDGRVSCEGYSSSTALLDGGTGDFVSGSQCTLYKPPTKGDPCGFRGGTKAPPSTQGDCQDSDNAFYCDSASGSCQPRIVAGQPCTGGGGTFACAIGTVCTSGVCTAATVGMDCFPNSSDCGKDLACSGTGSSGKCVAKKKAGEPCVQEGDSFECASGRCSKGKCSAGRQATAAACAGTPDKPPVSGGGSATGADGG